MCALRFVCVSLTLSLFCLSYNLSLSLLVCLAFSYTLDRRAVIEARDIRAGDRGRTSDPYAKVWVESNKYMTSVQDMTLNPRWDQEFKM